MKPKNMLFATWLVAVLSTTASAQDGNELLRQCEDTIVDANSLYDHDKIRIFSAGACFGLMQGITHLNLFYQNKKNPLFCLPGDGITNGQAARVVIKYLRDHPEKLHEIGSLLAIAAFVQAFPCNK